MDNSSRTGDDEPKRPSDDGSRPSAAAESGPVVPRTGDGDDGAARRGADIARDALRAAREVSAGRAAERAARRTGRPQAVRGRRRRWSGAGPDERDPQPFGRLVSRVSVDRGWSPRLTDATVLGRWPQLVGAEIADHCTPVSLRDGELVLQAESTAPDIVTCL